MEERRRLPDAELEVMQALWRQEDYPVSTAELTACLTDRRWQTATLIKLLSRLEERGFVAREKAGRGNRRKPVLFAAASRRFPAQPGGLPYGEPRPFRPGDCGAGGNSERRQSWVNFYLAWQSSV